MYTIVGADLKEYGPASQDQVRRWIAEGRANSQTLTKFEAGPWKPLSTYPEFAPDLLVSTPAAAAPPTFSVPVSPILPVPEPAPSNRTVIMGVVFGALALMQCCGLTLPFAGLGLVFSFMGYFQVAHDPKMGRQKGLAVAGIVLSLLGIVIYILLVRSGALNEVLREWKDLLQEMEKHGKR